MNIENTQNEIVTKLGSKLKTLLDKYEIFVVLIIILGIVLQVSNIELGSYLLIVSFSLLTVLYYFGAFAVIDDKNANNYEKFVDKFSGMSCSVILLGILFKLSNWPMHSEMLLIGSLSLLLALPTMIIYKKRKPELTSYDKRILMRVSILLLISGLLYFVF